MPEDVRGTNERDLTRRELLLMAGGAALAAQLGCAPTSEETAPVDGFAGLHYASLTEVADVLRKGEISAVELTQYMLERIGRVDAELHSYATVMADQALVDARQADAEIRSGNYRGPLHGVPVAVKDLCYTEGVRTMGGTAALAEFVPGYDATVVRKLREAGAVLIGKLNLTEGAMLGYNPAFDVPVNPWDAALWSGASSSGSGVATAAGLCFASLGSDTGGSIRFPSMANGIVGLKPTYGRVSRYGVLALAESLDHVGPMTSTVSDAAIMFEAIAGMDPNDPTTLDVPVPGMLAELGRGVEGVTIGYDRRYATDGVDQSLVEAMEDALTVLEGLGAEIVEVTVPGVEEALAAMSGGLVSYEAVQAHAETFPSRAADYGAYFREFLEAGASIDAQAYADATELRQNFSSRFRATLQSVDAIACPSGGTPFAVESEVLLGGQAEIQAAVFSNLAPQFTFPADLAGTPTISAQCGLSESGVPHTIQFMGAELTEPMLCRIALGLERATDWHRLHPEV
jgi:amidase